ncbi:MAG: pyruvate kinase, partial [Rhodothermales bacterium]
MEDVISLGTEIRGADQTELTDLLGRIEELIARLRSFERHWESEIGAVNPEFRKSATNLVHYLALRQLDLRELQERLARLGLSSLGRTEAHVMATLEAVRRILVRLTSSHPFIESIFPVDFEGSARLLSSHTDALFGPAPESRGVRIMVTMSPDTAADPVPVRELVEAGMDCARINCARGDESIWRLMVENVRRAERETGRTCRVLMDLAGIKPRTGALEGGPEVVRLKPKKDAFGMVIGPARIWLAPPEQIPPEDVHVDATLPVNPNWLENVVVGSKIKLKDARGKKRKLKAVDRRPHGVVAEAFESAYVKSGAILILSKVDQFGTREMMSPVGRLKPREAPIRLRIGDRLILLRKPEPGRPAAYDSRGALLSPARVCCTLPEILEMVHEGETVRFDDGKIDGVVRNVLDEGLEVEITRAAAAGSNLRGDRSINFPESVIEMGGITDKDVHDLDFVVRHADVVGLSFANSVTDVRKLQYALADRHSAGKGVILKVETRRGFQQLPHLLLQAMKTYPVGVMIARGDLAVECGWERSAEVQEEILWLCEAAHVPVIWATQVLEGLMKSGLPSRAEITDAAMAERAECVMLNKGPFVLEAIRMLDDVFKRMRGHQAKKTALLRSLQVS